MESMNMDRHPPAHTRFQIQEPRVTISHNALAPLWLQSYHLIIANTYLDRLASPGRCAAMLLRWPRRAIRLPATAIYCLWNPRTSALYNTLELLASYAIIAGGNSRARCHRNIVRRERKKLRFSSNVRFRWSERHIVTLMQASHQSALASTISVRTETLTCHINADMGTFALIALPR